jgi:hypothetical protein
MSAVNDTAAGMTVTAPRTLHAICELTRLAACGYCPAQGLDWPCASSGSGNSPDGYHVARFIAAMHRGLISGADLMTVLDWAGAFTYRTLVYDQPLGGRQ